MSRVKTNAPRVAKQFCEGSDKNSGGEPCRYYELPTRQCAALTKDLKADMFEHGRCLELLIELIDKELDSIVKSNPTHYAIKGYDKNPDRRVEHRDSEDIRYDRVVQDLRDSKHKFL